MEGILHKFPEEGGILKPLKIWNKNLLPLENKKSSTIVITFRALLSSRQTGRLKVVEAFLVGALIREIVFLQHHLRGAL